MDEPKGKKLSREKVTELLARGMADPIQAAILALTAINPVWGVLMGFGKAIWTTWGDFGQERVNELVVYISDHKEEFVREVIEGDDFKTLFLNVLERHMKEASEEKRKLLRNYLLNVGMGINPDFNEYTRMNNVIDNITLYEIDMLRLWDEDGVIETRYRNQRPQSQYREVIVISTLQAYIRDMRPRDERLLRMIDDENKSKNNQTLLLLGYKGLLYVLADNNFGSGEEARVSEITEFGKAFLRFIKEP
jgi:hypothetical protein